MYGPFLIERLIAYPRLPRRLAAPAAAHDELVRLLLLLARLHTLGLAPRRDRRTTARAPALITAQPMVDRVHRDAADLRPTAAAAPVDLVRLLLLLARLHPLGPAPRRDRRTTARGPALIAAQRMVDRVHRDAADLRPTAAPAHRAGLADRPQLVVAVADLADRRVALLAYHPHFRRRHAQRHVVAFLRDDLRARTRRAHDLTALAGLQLDVVHHRAQRNLAQRNAVAGADVRARPRDHAITLLQIARVQDVALLAIVVLDQRDVRRAVRVVLDVDDRAADAVLVALEVDATVHALRAAPTTPR